MEFRENRSCETQPIMLADLHLKRMQPGKQTDLILLDFSKALDKVAHENLFKLHHHGIRGGTLRWIKSFLDGRSQNVLPLRKHAYSNILKISPPKKANFQIKKF